MSRPLVQRIAYERGYGQGSWEGWTGPWRDPQAQKLWGRIVTRYERAQNSIAAMARDASEEEQAELASIAEQLEALDAKPILFQDGNDTLAALRGYEESLRAIHETIEARRKPVEEDGPEEGESADEESQYWLDALAGFLFVAAVAWQTYRDRRGEAPRGRGAYAAQSLRELAETFQQLSTDVHAVAQSIAASRQRLFLEGVRMGLNPLPMPLAREYESWQDVVRALYKIVFLVRASQAQIEDLAARLHRLNPVSPVDMKEGELDEAPSSEPGSESVGGSIAGGAVTRRNAMGAGFLAGSLIGSGMQSQVPVLSSSLLSGQVLWDGYHVANDLAAWNRRSLASMDAERRRLRMMQEQQRALREADVRRLRQAEAAYRLTRRSDRLMVMAGRSYIRRLVNFEPWLLKVFKK
jgi:hypothetical protein